MFNRLFYLSILFQLLFVFIGHSDEFDPSKEALYLRNVTQLTFPSMGFTKAGEGYFSPDGESIVFQAILEGEKYYQIFFMRLSEGLPKLISTGEGACTCAFFRPDGEKIIFASSHDSPLSLLTKDYKWELTPYMNIYECNLDGSNLTQLTYGPAYHAECAYSSDGSHIVYASNENGSMHIYTMRADGSDVKQITQVDDCYNGGPFFSPDNQQIIFRADRESANYLQVYVTNSDGSGERQLTRNDSVNWAPFWHPNGQVIAFTTSLHGHQHYEIYLLNVISKATCRLTHNATFDGLPSFRSDGKKMLWTSKRSEDQSCQLFIADFFMPEQLN